VLEIRNVETGEFLLEPEAQTDLGAILSTTFSSDGQLLAACGLKGVVRIWDAK
jgi:WD40 repeat protein